MLSPKRSVRASTICVFLALAGTNLAATDDVGEILNQIKAEKNSAIKPDKHTPSVSSAQSAPRKKPKTQIAPEKAKRPSPEAKEVMIYDTATGKIVSNHVFEMRPPSSKSAEQATAKPAAFTMPIHGTKGKLPRRIAGHGLVGEFFVLGEYIDGGMVLYATEDEGKGFIRQYVVVNRSSGMPPGNYHDPGRRPKLTFSREQPLVFVKKMFPGLYAVEAPQ